MKAIYTRPFACLCKSIPGKAKIASLGLIAFLVSHSAHAASQTYSSTGASANWSDSSNWGGNTAPGALGTTNNADIATFNVAPVVGAGDTLGNALVIDATRNLKSINFDSNAGSFFIGSTGGNALTLSAAGAIQILATMAGTGLTETINAPLTLGGAYTFANNKTGVGNSLVIGGNVTQAVNGTLTLSGSGTGSNTISGNLLDGAGTLSVTIGATAGTWTLSGSNNYSGLTNITAGGPLTVKFSGVNSSATGQTTIANASETVILNNSNNGGLAGGQFNLNGATLQSGVANLSLSNNVSNSGNVTINGANSITFNGNWTQTGAGRTLTSSMTSGTLTLAGNVYLSDSAAAGRVWTIAGISAGRTLITGTIADFNGTGTAGGITFNATAGNVLSLSGANTYSGTTTLTQGTLVVGRSSTVSGGAIVSGALGTGTLALGNTTNAVLQDNGTAITLANSVTASGASTFSSAGGGSLTFDGTGLTNPSTFALLANTTLTVSNTTTIKNPVSGAFTLAKGGAGTLVLNGNNTFTSLTSGGGGTTTLGGDNTGVSGGIILSSNGGLLNIANSAALGSGTFSIANNTSFDNTSGSDLTLSTVTPILLNGSIATTFLGTKSLNLGSGNVTLGGNGTISVTANTLTIGGAISGVAKNFTKNGAGTLVLAGANNYTGSTTISAGALNLQNSGALGTGPGASTSGVSVTSGGALQLQGGISTATAVAITSLNGAGVTANPNGALESVSGTNTYTGAITLGSAATIGADAGALNLTGGITNGFGLTLAGAGNITVSTGIISGAGNLIVSGSNGGTVTLSSANSYGGTTNVYSGTLVLAGNSSNTVPSVTGSANTTIALGSTSQTGAASIVTNGAYTIDRSIAITTNATNSSYTIGGIQTSGTSTYTGNITLRNNATLTLTAASGGEVDFVRAGSTKVSGTGNLVIDGGGTVKLGSDLNNFGIAGNTITVQNGSTLLASLSANLGAATNGLVFNNGALQFGAAFDASTRTITINSGGATFDTNGNNVSFANAIGNFGAGGLTKTGSGTLTLGGENTYTGATVVNAGTLTVNGSTASGSAVTVGGSATMNGSGIINGSVVVSGALSGSLTINGAATINSGATAAAAAFNDNVIVNGEIGSAVSLQSGKVLSGLGSVTGGLSAMADATVSPSNSGAATVGNLTVSSFNENASAHLALQINSTTAGDTITTTDNSGLTLAGDATFTFAGSYVPTGSDVLSLVINNGTGAVNGAFSGLTIVDASGTHTYSGLEGTLVTINGQGFDLTYLASLDSTAGNDVALLAVPEPSTWTMALGGLGILGFWQRSRRFRTTQKP